MTSFRRFAPLALVLCLLMSVVPVTVDGSAGNVEFCDVNPLKDEGFTLYNPTSKEIDLNGYTVTDGEGTLYLNSIKIAAKSTVTITTGTDGTWYSQRGNVYTIGSPNVTKEKSFVLSDKGDDLLLKNKDGKELDYVCYGNFNVSKKIGSWSGDTVPISGSSNTYIKRIASDTDTAEDWIKTKWGFTDIVETETYDAMVAPFVFPESQGTPIYYILENAQSEVYISIYQCSSDNLVGLLIELVNRGVEVHVLLEGDIFGGGSRTTELSQLNKLADAGGEVLIINGTGNYERFNYNHSKYIVIDGKYTVISSENFTKGNLSSAKGNRGWGIIVDNADYSSFMLNIWKNDTDDVYGDIKDIKARYPSIQSDSSTLTYTSPTFGYEPTWYSATVTPAMSPDNSFTSLKKLMNVAEDRIYAEQLDFSYKVDMNVDSPVKWMNDATQRGVDSRLILDCYTNEDNATAVDNINTFTNVNACGIKGGTGFGTTHNKGILIDDDITWVGSVNWTDNSFMNNRESAVIIHSEEVNSFYSGYFMTDWKNNSTEASDAEIKIKQSTNGNNIFSIELTGNIEGPFIWNIDGKEIESESAILPQQLSPGKHTVSISRSDGTLIKSVTFTTTNSGIDPGNNDENNTPNNTDDVEEEGYSITSYLYIVAGFVIFVALMLLRRK